PSSRYRKTSTEISSQPPERLLALSGLLGLPPYMAITSLDPIGKGRKRWITRWKAALNAFDGRLTPTAR
ncbi:hypothetical protein ACIBK7_35135, partial [Streptosporangium sandarakinum]